MDITTVTVWVAGILSLLSSPITSQSLRQNCKRTETGSEHCYFLHEFHDGSTWDDAYQLCQEGDGRRLAVIKGDHDQRRAWILIGTEADAWISGRRAGSEGNKWTYLDPDSGTEMLDGSFPSEKYCSRMTTTLVKTSFQCTEKHYGLCQNERESSEECDGMEDQNGFCWNVTPSRMTWFEARNYCRKKFHDSDLAVSVPSRDIVSRLEETMTQDIQMGSNVWIGLQRRPWMWRTPQGDSMIESYNFGADEGSDDIQSCLSVRGGVDASYWADTACESRLNNYICESVSESHETDDTGPDTGAAAAGPPVADTFSNNTVPIAASITVIGVASIVGALIFLYVRRRRIEKAQRRSRRRSISTVTSSLASSARYQTSVDRPRISSPMPIDVPYPVSTYANLGPLIPVSRQASLENPESAYSEIPSDEQTPPKDIQTIYGNLFGNVAPYATSVNFAESSPSERTVDHVTADNGDMYALTRKSDIENALVENLMNHRKMQQLGNIQQQPGNIQQQPGNMS